MKNSKKMVTVLKGFKGFETNVIDEILRIPQKTASKDKQGHFKTPCYRVSYKGKVYTAFFLNVAYSVNYPLCINID